MAGLEQNVPENTDKLLFAEDLVRHVMQGYNTSFQFPMKAEGFRNVVYNAFTVNVRDAIDFLICQFDMSSSMKFEVLKAAHMNNESSFLGITKHLRNTFFSKGFEARKFLYYCAHLSSMAGTFYSFGVEDTPHIATEAIAKTLSDYPMQSGAWDTVNAIAADLSDMAVSCDYSNSPADSLVRHHDRTRSPEWYSPRSNDEVSEDEGCNYFEKEVMKNISLDEFYGIDAEWRNLMISLYTEKESSSSEESS